MMAIMIVLIMMINLLRIVTCAWMAAVMMTKVGSRGRKQKVDVNRCHLIPAVLRTMKVFKQFEST